MFKSAAAILATLAAVVAAKNCRNINVPVSISARNGEFDVQAPATEIEVTNFFLNLARQNYNYTEAVLKGVSLGRGYACMSGREMTLMLGVVADGRCRVVQDGSGRLHPRHDLLRAQGRTRRHHPDLDARRRLRPQLLGLALQQLQL